MPGFRKSGHIYAYYVRTYIHIEDTVRVKELLKNVSQMIRYKYSNSAVILQVMAVYFSVLDVFITAQTIGHIT